MWGWPGRRVRMPLRHSGTKRKNLKTRIIEGTRAHQGALVETDGLESGPRRIGMKCELTRNDADAPVLGVEEATGLGALCFGNHAQPPS